MAELEVTEECTVTNSQFVVRESFKTFEELKPRLLSIKKENFVELWKRDCRTIAAARKRGIDRPLNPSLKYYDIKCCSIHGGQAFKPRGAGKRSTLRANKARFLKIRAAPH